MRRGTERAAAARMAYPPRYIPADSLVEVTLRTKDGAPLLRPEPTLAVAITAIIARALFLFSVQLHAFIFMSTHVHMLLTVKHADLLARFLRYVNRNVSVTVKRAIGHTGAVFEPRPHYAVVLGDAHALARLRYICSNSVKEGLVATPTEWPGASSACALLAQEDIVVRWANAAERRAAHRDGEDPRQCGAEYRIALAPIAPLERLSADQRRQFFATMYDELAAEAREARDGMPPVGRDRLVNHPPVVTCDLVERRGPIVHASTPEQAQAFHAARDAFIAAFRDASRRRAAGDLAVTFPPGANMPPGPGVPFPAQADPVGAARRFVPAPRGHFSDGGVAGEPAG